MTSVSDCVAAMRNVDVDDEALIHMFRTCVDRKKLCRRVVDVCDDRVDVRAVNLLIASHCFELNIQEDELQRSELHYAYQFANLQNINLLLAAGARADATDRSGAPPWHYAARNRDQTVMTHLLATGVDVNSTDRIGRSLLHRAAAHNKNAAVVAMLIDAGADVVARDEDGNTPCHSAARNKNVEVMRQLIPLCDINAVNDAGETPCFEAALSSNSVVLESLIRAGANLDAVTNDDMTVMAEAVYHHDEKSVELLVDANVDVNTVEPNDDWTALHVAAAGCNHRLIAKLIAAGADVNARNSIGETPCHMLQHGGKAKADDAMHSIALLMAANADVHVADDDGSTPLHYAARGGLTECVSLLLKAGADIEAKTGLGWSPLLCANDVAVAAVLIAANANLKHVDRVGRSACHHAAFYPRVLALLIAAGANPHRRGKNGETALHLAADGNKSSVTMSLLIDPAEEIDCSASMSMLINAGADVNQADNDGNCPAHWAARSSRVDNLKFLLEHGAQFNQRNNAGKTVFGMAAAASTDACETMRWLLNSGDIGVIDITAAHGADSSALLFLRSLGVNFNDADEHGNTACHHVRDSASLKLLFSFGAAVSAVNHNGQTPFEMHWATATKDRQRDELVMSFAAAGHCYCVAPRKDFLFSYTFATVVAGGGLVSAKTDMNRLLAHEARAIDIILQQQKELLRMRAWQVCIGLQSVRMSALEMCEILAHMFAPLESLVPFHFMWKVVVAVKHFAQPTQ
jgi:ankyrin repeat protein